MRYKFVSDSVVARIDDDDIIRISCSINDSAYQAWLAEGNTPEPADPPPVPVITSVTMRQARLALLQQGLLTQVNNAVASMPGAQGDAVRIEWEFSSTVERNRPFVNSLSDALGLTSIQLDNLFKLAATL